MVASQSPVKGNADQSEGQSFEKWHDLPQWISHTAQGHARSQKVYLTTASAEIFKGNMYLTGYVVILGTIEERLSFVQFILNQTKPINDCSSDPGLCLCPAAMKDS